MSLTQVRQGHRFRGPELHFCFELADGRSPSKEEQDHGPQQGPWHQFLALLCQRPLVSFASLWLVEAPPAPSQLCTLSTLFPF